MSICKKHVYIYMYIICIVFFVLSNMVAVNKCLPVSNKKGKEY